MDTLNELSKIDGQDDKEIIIISIYKSSFHSYQKIVHCFDTTQIGHMFNKDSIFPLSLNFFVLIFINKLRLAETVVMLLSFLF